MIADKDDSDDESLFIERPMLVTQRLVMRAPRESDIAELVQLADNRHVAQMLARMPHPYGEAEARAFIAMCQLRQPGATYALTLVGQGPEAGAFVGCAGLNAKDRGLELGYWIGEPYWKHGYATEAAAGLIDCAFGAGAKAVIAHSLAEPNASNAVMRKLGLRFCGEVDADGTAVWRWRLDRP